MPIETYRKGFSKIFNVEGHQAGIAHDVVTSTTGNKYKIAFSLNVK